MPRGAKPKARPPELIAGVRDLYERGQTQEEVALTLGITRKVVENIMQRASIPRRPRVKRDQWGEHNTSWRGDSVAYAAAHYRVYAVRGAPSQCEECGTSESAKRYEWANLTRNYADPMDYRRLCASCHKRFDGIARNLGAYAVRKEDRSA